MKKFVIITDSCSDLDKELRTKYDVEYIPMYISLDGKEMEADLDWGEITPAQFYERMREGARVKTAQITAPRYEAKFEKCIQDGCDVLSISCSSALSGSIEASKMARDSLLKKYPESKIICIDSLNAWFGLGLLCIRASEMRAEGKSIEETAAWIEANRKHMNQECTVDKLSYLKQAGRVSAASAFFGGLLSVKPIVVSDIYGNNAAEEKVKGRKNSMARLVERFQDKYEEHDYSKIFLGHADCLEEAEELKQMLEKVLPDTAPEIRIGNIGPIIGGSAGPGTLAIYFYGKKVTFDPKAAK